MLLYRTELLIKRERVFLAKIFTYKGKTIEELQALSIEDFAKLLPSRQRRTLVRRGMTPLEKKLLERMRKKNVALKTHAREMIILPEMVGRRFLVHTGKEWFQVDIKVEMLGHRLGEFALSRKKVMHSAPGVAATRGSKFLPLK